MIYCGEGALEKLVDYCQTHQLDRFLLVADENTYRVLGQHAEASLKEQGWDIRCVLLSGGEVVADESRLVEVLVVAGNEQRTFLSVGSGTITDITRFTSHRSHNRFISLPTAPSVDGYTSVGAPLILKSFKRTIPAHPPEAIFADLKTLCEAPRPMVAAGFGDILGKLTAIADWKLGHLVWDEPYSEDIARRVQHALSESMENLDEICRALPHGIARLMMGLFETGQCIADFGNSRPVSGSEHLLSHYWEIKLLQSHRPAQLHGAQVGVGTVLAARMYERLRGLDQAGAQARLQAYVWPDPQDEIVRIRQAYGPAAPEVIATHQDFLYLNPQAVQALKQRIIQSWAEIQNIAAPVPSAAQVIDLLEQAGGVTSPQALGLTEEEISSGLIDSHYMRDRFMAGKLCRMLGL
ncbi:MAG: iron-containing alcohol dehydrogenase [Anaerolineaceae bacterium]|nr:iron-containing alcohol dehydrogenase [Anaerolineaceae bacterium]